MQLWTSLADFRQPKSCDCPIGATLERERKEDKLHEFLKDLDESMYGSVKSNLLSRNPLPLLDEAYSVLLKDEDSKYTLRVMDEKIDTMAHVVRINQHIPSTPASSGSYMS